MADAFVAALPAILRAVQRATGALWMSIHVDGRLTPLPQDLDEVEEERRPKL